MHINARRGRGLWITINYCSCITCIKISLNNCKPFLLHNRINRFWISLNGKDKAMIIDPLVCNRWIQKSPIYVTKYSDMLICNAFFQISVGLITFEKDMRLVQNGQCREDKMPLLCSCWFMGILPLIVC